MDRVRWLRQYSQMSWTATSANGPTTPMKHCELYSKLFSREHKFLLCFIQLPSCGKPTRVFTRIRIPDHDLVFTVDSVFIPVYGKKASHDSRCSLKIS
ncbi:hypothetical protein HanRHA438_Chr17g0824411 [Helianthus annuus]|nr:hypothetical protein HanRHA438_Chr17g0824411 [Helianthus annuus]